MLRAATSGAVARCSKQDFSGCGRLRGGAGRTRTNHHSVMEHGWCPTTSLGRTPIQIAGRFDCFACFSWLSDTRTNHQSVMEHGWCPTNYPGRTPIQIVVHLLFSVIILAAGQTRTSNQILRKAVRVRPAHDVGHSSSASVSAETTFYWACHFRFSEGGS